MSADFVPYLAGLKKGPASAAPGTQPSGIDQDAKPFTPLVAGPAPTPAATVPPHTPTASAPSVSVTREGDRVMRIQVQCSCGEVIDLDCAY